LAPFVGDCVVLDEILIDVPSKKSADEICVTLLLGVDSVSALLEVEVVESVSLASVVVV
jgi:hypothetical protein